MSDVEALLRWHLTLTVVALALMPFVGWLGAGLGPARWGLLRPLALVALTAVVWWPAAAIGTPFTRATLIIGLVVVGSAGWSLWRRDGARAFEWRALLAFEALWTTMFLLYAWFRAYQPDILNTEKPMEIALLASISRSGDVPAPDPWFAGAAINYYYFGFQTIATGVKLADVPVAVGFNLALATIFASCATVAAGLGFALARAAGARRGLALASGGLAIALLLFAGNLETTRQLIDDPRGTVDAGWWQGVGWQASRVIYDNDVHQPGDERQTINEFPAFSFVLGDLHPHLLTYPLLAAVIALAVGMALSSRSPSPPSLAALGALAGLLYASNSWDAPTGALFVIVCLGLRHRDAWRLFARDVALFGAGAVVMAAPFILRFDPPLGVPNAALPDWIANLPVIGRLASTFGVVTWQPSSVRELLTVHGAWVLVFAAFATLEIMRERGAFGVVRRRPQVALAVAILAIGVAMAWAPGVILLGVPLIVAARFAAVAPEVATRVVGALFATGFLLALAPEFFYIQDVFADRMNTVFKLYFQAWLFLSVASAAALVLTVWRLPRAARPPATVGAIVIVAATLTYTPLSAQDWTNDFAARRGLDGRAYLADSAPGDLAVIRWLEEEATPGDWIVEAPGCSYVNAGGAPLSRMSAFSGTPTWVGWLGHETQWRRGQDPAIQTIVETRAARANDILDGAVPAAASGARFVVVGDQERRGSPDCRWAVEREGDPLERLAVAGWVVVFEADGTAVLAAADDPIARGSD